MEALERIVNLNGKCMSSKHCNICIFKKTCLPSFLSKDTAITQKARFNKALYTLTSISLLNDKYNGEETHGE